MRKIVYIIFFLAIALMLYRHEKWDKYYRNKIGKSPCKVIIDVSKTFKNGGVAIDLGCGVGNDAAFLTNNGWKVFAIDSESRAIELIRKRSDIKNAENLTLKVAKFDDESTWSTFSSVDLIYAVNSLPFCKKDKFEGVWNQLTKHIGSGGRFAGHFFGKNYLGFKAHEMSDMTFLDRDEVLRMFEEFEIEHFQEIEEDGISGTGLSIHSHIFEIIAKKK